jgi:Flp pilus assembly pilin Flp
MLNLIKRLWVETEGQDLTEYALLVVLIALVCVTAIGKLGSAINSVFANAASNLSSAT